VINLLRGVAILAIVLYHIGGGWFKGGYIGVDIFLVLSGFLITNSILTKFDYSGFNFFEWIKRRWLRIVPALLFCVVVIVSLTWLFSPDFRVSLARDSAAALSWTTNIYLITTGSSYMDQLNPNLFTHTWFLGLLMQFYLIWGLLVGLIFVLFGRYSRRSFSRTWICSIVIFFIAIILALLSYVFSVNLIEHNADPSLVYMLIFTHGFPLMLGSAGAALFFIIIPPLIRTDPSIDRSANQDNYLTEPSASRVSPTASSDYYTSNTLGTSVNSTWFGRSPRDDLAFQEKDRFQQMLKLIICIGLAIGFVALMIVSDLHETFYFVYGQFLVSILTLAAVSLYWTKPWDTPFTKWIGTRSFAIYLFHYPLFHLTGSVWFTFMGSLALAELTYFLIETPRKAVNFRVRAYLGRIFTLGLAFFAIFVLVTAPKISSTEAQIVAQTRQGDLARIENSIQTLANQRYVPAVVDNDNPDLWPDPPSVVEQKAEQKSAEARIKAEAASKSVELINAPVIIIGDSVCLNAATQIRAAIPEIFVDCQTSRFAVAGLDIIKNLKSSERLPNTVIVQLATNVSAPSYDAMTEIVKTLGPRRHIILVTGIGRGSQYDFMKDFASFIRDLAKKHSNVRVADWAEVMQDNQDMLSADGFHPGSDEARELLADEILRAYESF
jgi:peptidoglycan/LPS O-acetylase OafA/YrhL